MTSPETILRDTIYPQLREWWGNKNIKEIDDLITFSKWIFDTAFVEGQKDMIKKYKAELNSGDVKSL